MDRIIVTPLIKTAYGNYIFEINFGMRTSKQEMSLAAYKEYLEHLKFHCRMKAKKLVFDFTKCEVEAA